MKKISKLEVSEICNQLGESFPKNISQIYGGDINNSFKLDFQNYSIFLKKNIRKEKLLKYEYFCLKNLEIYNNTDDLIIPKINSYISLENTELLLMEWIDIENGSQLKLGKGLAEMHLRSNQSNQNKFGYEVEGFIGINKQMAGWGSNWADFFVNFRIKPQLKNLKRDFYNSNLLKNLISKIKTVLNQHDPTISLVHGDLWSGNFGINKDAKGVIFDPASWWADSEVDLAMTKLFGGFNHEFYQEYYKIIPMKSGFEKRLVIYNLYHVLNHANIFGGSYITQADEYMKIILDM